MVAKPQTHACRTDVPSPIATLNDAFRQTGTGGTKVATAGVIHLARDALPQVLEAVRAFDAFTTDNDPMGEHDFGALTWSGARLFWKIDYYDRTMRYASPDPADTSVTPRVLTIILASEY